MKISVEVPDHIVQDIIRVGHRQGIMRKDPWKPWTDAEARKFIKQYLEHHVKTIIEKNKT